MAASDIESQESEGLMAPLEEEEKNWWQERNWQTRIVQGVAIACAVIHVVAVAWESAATMVVLSAIFGIGLAVAVFWFQLQVAAEDSLRQVQNQLRHEVNRLFGQNKKLEVNNDRLEVQVKKLGESEQKLGAITEQQGTNVQNFVGLVKENRVTLEGLKKCLKADTEQMFLKAVLDSDWDGSNEFSDQEIQMLDYRLKSIHGVSVNSTVLSTKIKATDRTLSSVLGLLQELENDDLPDEERIFIIHEDQLAK